MANRRHIGKLTF